ncbi:hypothetical protein [Synechococcus sp. PCC 6312]|uniref:hypothetical protein n=1 Tax=Synechococcus sp. (strain ATCC 27167 / PCC 6312) TaxID=195253 RepID=UPI00029EE9CB|nr:hypothetical protein [Synechococcus sp. PCC 6312]AFY60571.1 hypothetical protein Syn6312_1400 [Synechococcus sp. PCC 6312]
MSRQFSPMSSLWVSLATPPLLCGILAQDIYLDVIQSVGKASLEIFRGEQLPLLKVSLSTQAKREE